MGLLHCAVFSIQVITGHWKITLQTVLLDWELCSWRICSRSGSLPVKNGVLEHNTNGKHFSPLKQSLNLKYNILIKNELEISDHGEQSSLRMSEPTNVQTGEKLLTRATKSVKETLQMFNSKRS